jgi:hypothetical protein
MLSRTCRKLYDSAGSVLYRSFLTSRLPAQYDFPEALPAYILPDLISPIACGFVNELAISYSTFILQCAYDRYDSLWTRISNCTNLRRLHFLESSALDGFHVEPFFSAKNASRTWRLLQRCFILNPFLNVTELSVYSQILCRRGIPCQILPYLPSLHTLDASLCDIPLLGQKSGYIGYEDPAVLSEDIGALSVYCPDLAILKLPVWASVFRHPEVRSTLSKQANLRQLWFQKQHRHGVKEHHPIHDYIGFRLYLEQKAGVEVIDSETMTFLSTSNLPHLNNGPTEMMLDYICSRLSPNTMIQLGMKITEYPTNTLVSILSRYGVSDHDGFRVRKRVNLRLCGRSPLSSQLPKFITSVTFLIEPPASFLHWLPTLRRHVSSPTLRAMSLRFHHATFREFSQLYVRPPYDVGFEKKVFEFCRWRRPIAAPSGFECIHNHHQWSYFGNYRGHCCSQDENLEIESRSARDLGCHTWYTWPTDSGELDIMEKYGMEMESSLQLEKYLIRLADSAAYVAFHLEVQISNYRSS